MFELTRNLTLINLKNSLKMCGNNTAGNKGLLKAGVQYFIEHLEVLKNFSHLSSFGAFLTLPLAIPKTLQARCKDETEY
ncbi:MAG: hypothetical protein ACUVRG_10705 [Ignavibacterium sp.]|uniref:hypothetical protein n=1 Tax=Ignavibacterium sp. TaxID=2651167 RepID=UPI0040493CA8